jgi:hypothetical protein
MVRKRLSLSLLIILILIISITPKNIDAKGTVDERVPMKLAQQNSIKGLNEEEFNPLFVENDFKEVENSNIGNNFEIKDNSNESNKDFSLENCEDWSLQNNFNFSNIRSEKIVNGDAESTEELWTDYLPPQYEGNVTRESDFPLGDVISGNYSWYFNLSTNDYAVIIGFDDPIDISSDSVIFSFSYSLLRNNLGTSYDSNICIRLFFQFDIYIFFWFNGNIGVLSNVTGPGGYADLLVDGSSFDGVNHHYSLNVTALGLELFDQKPDQLRSLAVQTWGELPSYQMEFLIDNLSLTDQLSPSSIDLRVNSNSVTGDIAFGHVSFFESPNFIINYQIEYTSSEKILFDYNYEIIGNGEIESQRMCFFEDWDTIKWNESTNITLIRPSLAIEVIIFKWIPVEWSINQVLINGLSHSFEIKNSNSTHKKIELTLISYDRIELIFHSPNLINNVILSSYQITHNDNLTISIESDIFLREISVYIIDLNGDVYYSTLVNTNAFGEALITDIQLDGEMPRGIHSVYVFWNMNNDIGIGKRDFEITTYPTTIKPYNTEICTNYKQNFLVEIDYIDIEINETIDFATVEYSWLYGTGILLQSINKSYYVEVSNTEANPGTYFIYITCNRNGYAQAKIAIEIEVVFTDYSLSLLTPDNALPGEFLTFHSLVKDNFSQPVSNVKTRFEVNGNLLSDSWTNITGFSKITYQISPIYQLNNLNVSCSIILSEFPFLTTLKTINITISEIPQEVQLNSLVQNIGKETNETLFFNYTIIYPSFGKNWYITVPIGFNPLAIKIITETDIILANIIGDIITWQREINTTLLENDILEIETYRPQITTTPTIQHSEISIDITITTNHIPYKNLEVKIPFDAQWLIFDQWSLYLNGELVTDQCNLVISSDYIIFYLNNTQQVAYMTYQLIGIKSDFIQISPATIILGIGTLILTCISVILLLKKKTNVSLDVQI